MKLAVFDGYELRYFLEYIPEQPSVAGSYDLLWYQTNIPIDELRPSVEGDEEDLQFPPR
jgi:hypothetical protein